MDAADGSTCRYCLAEWAPAGPSAVGAFLRGLGARGYRRAEPSADKDADPARDAGRNGLD
jgi:hypothetical protein